MVGLVATKERDVGVEARAGVARASDNKPRTDEMNLIFFIGGGLLNILTIIR